MPHSSFILGVPNDASWQLANAKNIIRLLDTVSSSNTFSPSHCLKVTFLINSQSMGCCPLIVTSMYCDGMSRLTCNEHAGCLFKIFENHFFSQIFFYCSGVASTVSVAMNETSLYRRLQRIMYRCKANGADEYSTTVFHKQYCSCFRNLEFLGHALLIQVKTETYCFNC